MSMLRARALQPPDRNRASGGDDRARRRLPAGAGDLHDASGVKAPAFDTPQRDAIGSHRHGLRVLEERAPRLLPRLDPDRLVVAPNAAGERFFNRPESDELEVVRKRYRLPANFVLAVGNVQPRKNLARTAEAAARCGVPLVVVGRHHGKDLEGPVAAAQWLGYVPDTDLVALYRLCTVFCYVSLYEGFGLPVLEALASGAVVLTSQITAMPEVAGGAALFADPLSVDSIADQLAKALGDEGLRDRLKVAGPVRAKDYSWTNSAAVVLGRVRQLAR